MKHELKILPEYFKQVMVGYKNFELRKDDRNYNVKDTLLLREFDGEKYTGYIEFRQISYILRDCEEYGLKKGFVILGFMPIRHECLNKQFK